MGTARDAEVAARVGRTTNAVRVMHALLLGSYGLSKGAPLPAEGEG